MKSRWTARYTLDFPPNTTDTISIYPDQGDDCLWKAEGLGSLASVTVSTQTGSAPVIQSPQISAITNTTLDGLPYVKLSWPEIQAGQVNKLYRTGSDGRYGTSTVNTGNLTRTNNNGTWHYTSTDDLSTMPAGTYYYGGRIYGNDLCSVMQTNQTAFFWHGPPSNTQLKLLLWDDGVTTETTVDSRYTNGNSNPTYYVVELKDNAGHPIANQPVAIVSKLTGAPLINLLANNPVTTGSNGQVVFNISQSTPQNPEIYYAQYAGNAEFNPSVSNIVSQRCCDPYVWCEYRTYAFTTFGPGQNNNLNKQLNILKACRATGGTFYNTSANLNVGDSFSKGEVRPCQIDGTTQQCVVGQFKYYYSCAYSTCPQVTVNYVNPSTPLACNPSQAFVCNSQTPQVCQGTQLDYFTGSGSTNVLLMPTQTSGGNPIPGVPPIQLACASATTAGGGAILGWQVASLGYASSENNRSQVYPVGCINNNDCKVNQYCDTSGNWYTWACRQLSTPPRIVRVFVTNGTFTGDLGGLSGADNKCQTEASGSNITDVKNARWKAWLSTSTVDAKDRIQDAVYSLVDYTLIAHNKTELLSDNLANLINGNKDGQPFNLPPEIPQVWTGTNTDGTKSSHTCNDWNPDGHLGTYGNFTSSNLGLWTTTGNTSSYQCKGFPGNQFSPPINSVSYHLYCFEDISGGSGGGGGGGGGGSGGAGAPPPLAQTTCGSGSARADALVSTPRSETGSKFNTSGGCVVDTKAAFVPYKIPTFDDLKSLYYTQK